MKHEWTVTEWIMRLDISDMTFEQYCACLFLERRGLRFLVDFGYCNAISKALELAPDTVN